VPRLLISIIEGWKYVGMVQFIDRLSLSAETFKIDSITATDYFDCDLVACVYVLCQVDL
jgi:hypothetical protein